MTKASDNAFPSVLLTEGGPPSAPAAGTQRLWTNSSNLNMITAAGVQRVIGAATASAAVGAPAAVQVYQPAAIGDNATATLAGAPGNGNRLILFAGAVEHYVTSITQTNVTWTRIANLEPAGSGYAIASVWQGLAAASAGTGVTVDFNGNNQQFVSIIEYEPCTVDGVATQWQTGVRVSVAQSLAHRQPGGLYVAYHYARAAVSASPATGWTDYAGSRFAISTNHYGRVAYLDAETNGDTGVSFWDQGVANYSQSLFLLHLTAS